MYCHTMSYHFLYHWLYRLCPLVTYLALPDCREVQPSTWHVATICVDLEKRQVHDLIPSQPAEHRRTFRLAPWWQPDGTWWHRKCRSFWMVNSIWWSKTYLNWLHGIGAIEPTSAENDTILKVHESTNHWSVRTTRPEIQTFLLLKASSVWLQDRAESKLTFVRERYFGDRRWLWEWVR